MREKKLVKKAKLYLSILWEETTAERELALYTLSVLILFGVIILLLNISAALSILHIIIFVFDTIVPVLFLAVLAVAIVIAIYIKLKDVWYRYKVQRRIIEQEDDNK